MERHIWEQARCFSPKENTKSHSHTILKSQPWAEGPEERGEIILFSSYVYFVGLLYYRLLLFLQEKQGLPRKLKSSSLLLLLFSLSKLKQYAPPAHITVPDISVSTNTSDDSQALWCSLPPWSQAHFLSVPASSGSSLCCFLSRSSFPVAVRQLNEFRLGTEEMMNLPREPMSKHSFGRVLATTKPQNLVGFLARDIVSLTDVPLLNRWPRIEAEPSCDLLSCV